jgi:hypothetical protein
MTASSLYKKPSAYREEKEKKISRVYRSVRFDRPVELHGSSALLHDFCILSVQPSLLVFLHPSNFFLKSGLKKDKHQCSLEWKRKYLFLARLSLSASPVGANESARVASSSRAWRPRTYALITAGSRMISVCQSPSTLLSSVFPVSGNNVRTHESLYPQDVFTTVRPNASFAFTVHR